MQFKPSVCICVRENQVLTLSSSLNIYPQGLSSSRRRRCVGRALTRLRSLTSCVSWTAVRDATWSWMLNSTVTSSQGSKNCERLLTPRTFSWRKTRLLPPPHYHAPPLVTSATTVRGNRNTLEVTFKIHFLLIRSDDRSASQRLKTRSCQTLKLFLPLPNLHNGCWPATKDGVTHLHTVYGLKIESLLECTQRPASAQQ